MSAPLVSRRMERGILALFAVAAAVLALTLQVPAVRVIIAAISTGEVPVDLVTATPLVDDGASPGPVLVTAAYDHASVVAAGLSPVTAGLVLAGLILNVLTAVVVGGAVVWFILLLLWSRPFHGSLSGASLLAGGSLLLGGILSTGVGGLGRMQAATELNPAAGDVFEVAFTFDPGVALAGVVVLTLSIVFTRGSKLQQDTRGLV